MDKVLFESNNNICHKYFNHFFVIWVLIQLKVISSKFGTKWQYQHIETMLTFVFRVECQKDIWGLLRSEMLEYDKNCHHDAVVFTLIAFWCTLLKTKRNTGTNVVGIYGYSCFNINRCIETSKQNYPLYLTYPKSFVLVNIGWMDFIKWSNDHSKLQKCENFL